MVSRMSSAPKRASRDDDYVDRLSDLPDGVLCHILSFLDTKYAMATSVLSNRWKNLFLSLPNVFLDDSLSRKRRNKKFLLEFSKFGLKQIMLRDVPHINQFQLRCSFNFEDPAIQTLVCAAIWRNVKELDICASKRAHARTLPPEIFTSRTLVVLKLVGHMELNVPESVCLPNLKVMMLGFFILPSDDAMRRLFRGCKQLEDLSLCNCNFWLVEVLDLSIPLLKKLSFNDPCSIVETKLVIDTPNLKFLDYQGYAAKFNLVKKLESLIGAKISFVIAPKLKLPFVEDHRENVSEFINKLLGVKSLYLNIDALEVMYPGCFSLYVFETLTFLELGPFDHRILPSILESTPQLQKLVIPIHVVRGNAQGESTCSLPETVPICLVKHLREIKFKYFQVIECEFQLVKYFLQNGKVLERMKIARLGPFPWRFDYSLSARKKISMFTRCSETCDIVFEESKI